MDDECIIKKADKGGAIVVWGKDMYVKEANRQLNNTDFYQPLPYCEMLIGIRGKREWLDF